MKAPYPPLVRRVLKKTLPNAIYRRYVGRHEDYSMKLWRKLAAQVSGDDSILDVGAYHGEYALAAREVNASAIVVAFEPDPKNLAVLVESCCDKEISIQPVAVGATNGVVKFACNGQAGSVSLRGEGVSVDCVTLERIVPRIALAKIDVEGYEDQVLLGGANKLAADRPAILCEVLSEEGSARVMAALPPNYRFFRIDENRGIKESPVIYRDDWRYKNWLLVPQEKLAALTLFN